MLIKKDALVLFQGDSITDWGRNYEDPADLGQGYALMTAAWFSALHPELNVKFLNRGISGNRTSDLVARWQQDCLDLQPDVLSLLIGINDTWRRFDQNDPTTPEAFEDHYRSLLTTVRQKLNCPIIIGEPFLLPVTPEQQREWRADLNPKIDIVRSLAQEFNAIYLPLDGIFAAASTKQPAQYWAADGVHPTPAGQALISRAWLQAVGAL
ncbi:MAG TPA: SGNH/GDSL hydrolase family protein [Firmicutes bacterium]|nr:SGNH/GDSL hydrolase family protein [Bacillota bacterium]